jgi:hypothetical protein
MAHVGPKRQKKKQEKVCYIQRICQNINSHNVIKTRAVTLTLVQYCTIHNNKTLWFALDLGKKLHFYNKYEIYRTATSYKRNDMRY